MRKLTKNEIIARVKNCKLAGRSVYSWLIQNHPEEYCFTNGFNETVTFIDLVRRMFKGEDFYEILSCTDSVQREKIFSGLADESCTGYDVWYYCWLSNGRATTAAGWRKSRLSIAK